ncbi:MAG: DUF1538 family protein, partial [Chloroflexi bacterium]|nr:DUF1538 family protein [Chloroflexota bacterium]
MAPGRAGGFAALAPPAAWRPRSRPAHPTRSECSLMAQRTTTDDIRQAAVQYQVRITPKLVLSILWPYASDRIKEQIVAVGPISLFLLLFQIVVLRQGILDAAGIAAGLSVVILGLMFFMDGLRLGLMPLGANIGATLPAKARMWLILTFAFLVGVGATYAEPAISTLKAAGANVKAGEAPLLYEMLNRSSGLLVMAVGVGVGIATVLGVFRNESRMMMRVWAQGYAWVLLAGLLAAPWALRSVRATARPV